MPEIPFQICTSGVYPDLIYTNGDYITSIVKLFEILAQAYNWFLTFSHC